MKVYRVLEAAGGRLVAAEYPAAEEEPRCDDRTISDDDHTYRCTRPAAHQGPHVAHTRDGRAVAVWGA